MDVQIMKADWVLDYNDYSNFSDRVRRFQIITADIPGVVRRFPLMVEVNLGEFFSYLERFAQEYLSAALDVYYDGLFYRFPDSGSMLSRYRDKIVSLPNITPNGAFMPAREITLEFNLLHRGIERIFESFGIDRHVAEVHLPAGVRIVDGRGDETKDARPYSSTKLHTDFWNGDPLCSLVVFIPVLGDIERTTMKFYEPLESEMNDVMRTLADYNEGAFGLTRIWEYDGAMRLGFAYITDSLLLHRTIKNNGGLRFSVNFRFIPKRVLKSERDTPSQREMNWHRNFVPLVEWYAVGEKNLLVPQETFPDMVRKYRGTQTHPSSIIDLGALCAQVPFVDIARNTRRD